MFGDDNAQAPLTLLRREENEGAAGGMNAGLRLLLYDPDCTAFWLLHNDTLPEPYALAALLRHTQDEKNIGMVGSTLLFHDKDLLECAAGGHLEPPHRHGKAIGRRSGTLRPYRPQRHCGQA